MMVSAAGKTSNQPGANQCTVWALKTDCSIQIVQCPNLGLQTSPLKAGSVTLAIPWLYKDVENC
jgi:hypothetical protein